jgi:hypothetical protein
MKDVAGDDIKAFYQIVVAELEPLKDSPTFSKILETFTLLAGKLGVK